jgi:glycosyltransferase involved in cell wall biosynthesis
VITVCWNAAAVIGPTLESVRAQTYPGIEQVIIDGASSDHTLEIVRAISPDAVIVSEPDKGIYDAMNKGVATARGELLYFLNAGDRLVDPEALWAVADFFEAHPEVDMIYGGLLVVDLDGSSHDHLPPPPELAAEELVRGCLPHQAAFARRKVFELTGPFDLRYRIHADHDWFVKRIERTIAAFQLGGASARLEDSQPEFYAILNSTPEYQSEAWMRRRVEILQEMVVTYRAEAERLKAVSPSILEVAPKQSEEPTPPPMQGIGERWGRKLARVRDRRA